ncbi:MAG TPA: hypothetical protein EYN91_08535 [Candidatus Melainabacteria bacterium]|nr:hypothetical protein [Candidatus Melainabacteria bacterium]
MNILSYRGPSTPGGVSATLSRVIDQTSEGQKWWFLHGAGLRKRSGKQTSTEEVCQIPFKIIEGHYRYCNEFLWPILHDLPQYAHFDELDRQMYVQLNTSVSWNVLYSFQPGFSERVFVNDYQLALCPQALGEVSSSRVDLFWHIPWPRRVEQKFAPHLAEIARGILHASKIGFHIEEYSTNFLLFVDRYLSDFKVDFPSSTVTRADGGTVSVVAHPLGLDADFWLKKVAEESPICREIDLTKIVKFPFVLSVDRADYTKGVVQRLEGIEHFLCSNPDKIGKVTFIQICQKSRGGLSEFDNYWQECRTLSETINSRWKDGRWQPIVWVDVPISSNVLAWLYRRANTMLVTPVRDGLNLTAKEFSLCSEGGALILSAQAGAWTELSDDVLTLVNLRAETISEQIAYALAMPRRVRRERMARLKKNVLSNSLAHWWKNFGGEFDTAGKVVPLSVKVHHSVRKERWIAR